MRSIQDLAEATAWLVLAALAYAATLRFDPEILNFRYGAFGWPRAAIALLAFAAAGLLLSAWSGGRAARRNGSRDPAHREVASEMATESVNASNPLGQRFLRDSTFDRALVFLVPVLFGTIIHYAGLLLTAPVFVVAYGHVLGYRGWRNLAIAGLATFATITLVFVKLLNAYLPMGKGVLYTINAILIEALR